MGSNQRTEHEPDNTGVGQRSPRTAQTVPRVAEYNNAEIRNVAMDLTAKLHYNDENTDRLWEQRSGPVAIDGHP